MLERGRRCRQQPQQQLRVVSSFSLAGVEFDGIRSCRAGCLANGKRPCCRLLVHQSTVM